MGKGDAEIQHTYRVKGKEISVVICGNKSAGRAGQTGIYIDGTTYVLKDKDDARKDLIEKIGPDVSEWRKRSWQVAEGGLWNTTVMLQVLLSLLPKF